jgi:hypothetical protein
MTVHTPPICANSVASAYPAGSGNHLVLLDTNGYPAESVLQNQTWQFTGSDWTDESPASVMDPAGPLPGRTNPVMAYDGSKLMLFGGASANILPGVLNDHWEYNGTSWSQLSLATLPPARYGACAAYLSGTGVVMFGGRTSGDILLGDTWVWSGSAWSQTVVANGTGPGYRSGAAMGASTSQALMFGGQGNYNCSRELWSYASGAWTQIVSASGVGPSARTGACLVWDATASLFVLMGGANQATFCSDQCWTFNPTGNVWTQITWANGTGPSDRINAQMAYDSVSGRVILFGGRSASENLEATNDTWALTTLSSSWAQL